MVTRDDRFLLRKENIEKAKSAGKLFRAYLQVRKRAIHWWYVRQPIRSGQVPLGPTRNLLISVAFNDPTLVALQARAVSQFLQGEYELVVIDNSSDGDKRAAIRALADRYGFTYVPAPRNPYSWRDPSVSHSLALDWCWKNVVRVVAPTTVVFLDHDLFPIGVVDIESLRGAAIAAGYRRDSDERWLLWPGLLALDFWRVDPLKPSFMPRKDTDSGGSLWWQVYSQVPQSEIRFLQREDIVFADTAQRFGDGSAGEMHLFDGHWLHLVDGSGWSDGIGKIGKLPLNDPEVSLEGLIQFVDSFRQGK